MLALYSGYAVPCNATEHVIVTLFDVFSGRLCYVSLCIRVDDQSHVMLGVKHASSHVALCGTGWLCCYIISNYIKSCHGGRILSLEQENSHYATAIKFESSGWEVPRLTGGTEWDLEPLNLPCGTLNPITGSPRML